MIRISVLCLVVFSFCNSGVTWAAKWNYKQLDEWPKQCFVGKSQSPIDLSPDIAEGKNFPPFRFEGYDEIYTSTIKNNGHTIEVRLDVGKRPTVSGGGLTSNYALEAMHFHWASEHTVEGRRFPLELHLVHYDNRSKDLAQALFVGRVAVLGVFFYISPDDDTEFAPMFDAIQHLQQQKVTVNVPQPIRRLELDDFLPRDRAGFYRYNGSLTTPGCTEGVLWTVFTNGLPISHRQLKIFSNLLTEENIPMESNYRPVQDLNDRIVYLKTSDMDSAANFVTLTTSLKMFMLFVLLKVVM